MPSTTIARGNSLSTFYVSAPLAPTAVSTTSGTQTYSLPGLLTTDNILIIGLVGAQTAGIAYAEAECLTAGVLSVQYVNTSGGSATPVTGNYVLQIVRSEGPLPATAV
jgi:hypothetical protein